MAKIRLCPRCRKPTLRNATNVSGWLAPAMYKCSDEDCRYLGYVYIEVDPNDLELEEIHESENEEKI